MHPSPLRQKKIILGVTGSIAAYKAADRNDFIPLDAIARTLPDGDLLADYLHNG